jgi:hypothetical protein
MASRRCIMLADAWLTGFGYGNQGRAALPDVHGPSLCSYLRSAGYQVTQVEAMTMIKDYLRRGTLLV